MSAFTFRLVSRDASDSIGISHTAFGLLVALLVLILFGIIIVGALLFMRRRRRSTKQSELPLYAEKRLSSSSTASSSNHRRVMIRPSESVYVYQEKKGLMDECSTPPASPLPEIRITFPEEYDASGKRTSGRVVVVRVGDTTVGLEPLQEKLPAYQHNEGGRFDSVDLERVGGLTEKERTKHWS